MVSDEAQPAGQKAQARSRQVTWQPQEEAVHLVRSLSGARDRSETETELTARIGSLNEHEVTQLLVQFEKSPPLESIRQVQFLLVRRWAHLNPRAAFDYVQKQFPADAELPGAGSFKHATLVRWMNSDPYGALAAWQETEGRSDADLFTLELIFRSITAKRSVNDAIDAVGSLEPAYQTHALQGVASMAALPEARDQILERFVQVEDPSLRVKTLGEALSTWASTADPLRPAQWLNDAALPESDKRALEKEIAEAWLLKNQPQAAEWYVQGSSSGADRDQRLSAIVSAWAYTDPRSCGAWLLQQPDWQENSQALKLFAGILAKDFPSEAIEWARAVPDAAARAQALAKVESEIKERYPERMKELLGEAP